MNEDIQTDEQESGKPQTSLGPSPFALGIMGVYLRLLSVIYAAGLVLHFMDLLDQRYNFSGMSPHLKVWSVCLFVGYFLSATGLWFRFSWGVVSFIVLAAAQWVAALAFPRQLGHNWYLLAFHLVAVLVFGLIYALAVHRSNQM